MSTLEPSSSDKEGPAWQPLAAIDRRIVGVLVEKAKTTPESYPLTANALRNGANQKSNRSPAMQLDDDQIEEALDRLRGLGAVVELHDSGRAVKFRHRMYEWLGVDKVELAIMTELLLRGAQTIGELRGRAARMEPIADLAALRPFLASLEQKGLIAYLTPQGRGCVVTHSLYRPNELDQLRAQYGTTSADQGAAAASVALPSHQPPPASPPASAPTMHASEPSGLETELQDLRQEIAQLLARLEETETGAGELQRAVDDLRRQLGV